MEILKPTLPKHKSACYYFSGDNMLKYIENLKLVSVIRGVTNPNAVHINYPHRLILRLTGTVRYHLPDQKPVLSPGDVLFLANSPPYHGEILPSDSATYILVNFEGSLPDTPTGGYALYGQTELHNLFLRLYQNWSVQTPANQCRCMALLYELLSHFAGGGHGHTGSHIYSRIQPALTYLEAHIFDPDLKIGSLHERCGMSDTYFRQIFLARFGVSPKRYVIDRRLTQAMAILDNGDFSTIGEVALMVGFEDALYFSKAFRSKYGYPPSAQ